MRIKVCGLTNLQDAEQSARLGAWGLGFIFYRKSPRFVDPERVRSILMNLDQLGIRPERCVGVFVNEEEREIRRIVKLSGIDTVQLHGDESPEFFSQLADLRLWKAARLRDEADIQSLDAYAAKVEAFLFDAAVKGSYGGTGHLADWGLLDRVPRATPMIISGGLNPSNVNAAWARFQPLALDLASGVEANPGIKDHDKLKQLFAEQGAPYAKS